MTNVTRLWSSLYYKDISEIPLAAGPRPVLLLTTVVHERAHGFLLDCPERNADAGLRARDDMRVRDLNESAQNFFGLERGTVLKRPGGEALHCLNSTGGCGQSYKYTDCVIRNSVIYAWLGKVYRGDGCVLRFSKATRVGIGNCW